MRISPTGDAGYTLTEVLVVLLIIAGAATIVPAAVSSVLPGVRFQSDVRELKHILWQQRTQAISNGATITVPLDQPEALGCCKTLTFEYAPVIAQDTNALIFYANGGSSGGTLTITRGGRTARLHVDWLTGQVGRAP